MALSEAEAIRAGLIPAKSKRQRDKPSHAGEDLGAPQPTRCHPCGEVFPTYAAADKHMTREHHGNGRLEAVTDYVPPSGFHLDLHTPAQPGDVCPHCGKP